MDNSPALSSGLVQADEASDSSWAVHLGPFSVVSSGIDVKPQLKVGGQFGCVRADYGLGDVREGLKLDMSLSAQAYARTTGQSITELHENMRRDLSDKAAFAGQAAQQALDTAGRILSTSACEAGSQIARIAAAVGLDAESFTELLSEAPPSPMSLRATASTGFGMNFKLCLGWTDPDGYKMVGISTKLTTGLTFGGDVFAGKHSSGTSLKILVGIGNLAFEYIIPIRTEGKSSGDNAKVDASGSS